MASVDSGVETESESNNEDSNISNQQDMAIAVANADNSQVPAAAAVLAPFALDHLSRDSEETNFGWQVNDGFDFEPPAGLVFCNIQQCLSFGQGYESIPDGGPRKDIGSWNCKIKTPRSARMVKIYQREGVKSWSRWKLFLGERKLRLAANTNDVEKLRNLLETGVDPKSSDEFQRTAMHMAAAKGYADIIRVLLQYGADPNQTDSLGNTPLHLAACTNHVHIVTLLLKAGANVKLLDRMGRNPLQLAESKLRMLQQKSTSADVKQVFQEFLQVVEMMKTYLEKTGKEEDIELLEAFSQRLTLDGGASSATTRDVESNVSELLASLTSLSLKSGT